MHRIQPHYTSPLTKHCNSYNVLVISRRPLLPHLYPARRRQVYQPPHRFTIVIPDRELLLMHPKIMNSIRLCRLSIYNAPHFLHSPPLPMHSQVPANNSSSLLCLLLPLSHCPIHREVMRLDSGLVLPSPRNIVKLILLTRPRSRLQGRAVFVSRASSVEAVGFRTQRSSKIQAGPFRSTIFYVMTPRCFAHAWPHHLRTLKKRRSGRHRLDINKNIVAFT